MACYIVRSPAPSHEQFKTWVMMGYTGSYEMYLAHREPGPTHMHICGDLGPHCAECAGVGGNLCDYPVGNDKTCDRPLCDDHATEVAPDVHYCRAHFIM